MTENVRKRQVIVARKRKEDEMKYEDGQRNMKLL